MGDALRLLAVIASAVAAAASASSGQRPYNGPNGGTYAHTPSLERHQVIAASEQDGVKIGATTEGAAGWSIAIHNDTEELVSVEWDACTFVTSHGQSAGRLIRGETRRMDVGRTQPASPVAPGTMITEVAFPEQFIDYEEDEANAAAGDATREPIKAERRREQELIEGGKLVMTVSIGDKKITWTGPVESTNVDTDAGNSASGSSQQQP